jgi:hypothetical protein
MLAGTPGVGGEDWVCGGLLLVKRKIRKKLSE